MRILKTAVAAILALSIIVTSCPIAFAEEKSKAADSKTTSEKVESAPNQSNFSLCSVSGISGKQNHLLITFNYPAHLEKASADSIFVYPAFSVEGINDDAFSLKKRVSSFEAVNPVVLEGIEYAYQYDLIFDADIPEKGIIAISESEFHNIT